MRRVLGLITVLVLVSLVVLTACAAQPSPTPTQAPVVPTKAPEPTKAPAAPTKAPEPTKAPAAAAPAPAPAAAPAKAEVPEMSKIKVGTWPFADAVGLWVALKQGYFKDEGLEVEWTNVGGADALSAMQGGSIHVSSANIVSAIQGAAEGFGFVIISGQAQTSPKPPDGTGHFVLKESGITDAKGLVGKKFGINAIKGIGRLYTEAWFKKNGVDPKSVSYVEVPFAGLASGLLNKQVDGIQAFEPQRTILLESGKALEIGYPYIEVQPGMEMSPWIAMEKWTKGNPITLKKWVKAMNRATTWANDPKNEKELRQYIVEFAKLDPAYAGKVYVRKYSETVKVEQVQKTADLMFESGELKAKVDVKSYLHEYAINPPK